MAKDASVPTLRPAGKRPGKRWGMGLASIVELLGTRPRAIEDDVTRFADTQPLDREIEAPGAAGRQESRGAC